MRKVEPIVALVLAAMLIGCVAASVFAADEPLPGSRLVVFETFMRVT